MLTSKNWSHLDKVFSSRVLLLLFIVIKRYISCAQVSVSDSKFVDNAVVRVDVKELESSGLHFSSTEYDAEVLENTTNIEHVAILPIIGLFCGLLVTVFFVLFFLNSWSKGFDG